MEESALGMGQLSELAAMEDALTKSSREESALDMGQPINLAAMKDAPTKPGKEESVGGIVRRRGQL